MIPPPVNQLAVFVQAGPGGGGGGVEGDGSGPIGSVVGTTDSRVGLSVPGELAMRESERCLRNWLTMVVLSWYNRTDDPVGLSVPGEHASP